MLIASEREGKWPIPHSLPVRGVDVGRVRPPAPQLCWQVGDPQGVPPAVPVFEQGELRARVRPLAAGKYPHRRWPGGELVPAGTLAEQAGELGDVGFLDPAPLVGAPGVTAGAVSTPLAHLAAAVNGDLPGRGGDQADRVALALAQRPPDGVDQLADSTPAHPGR